MSESEFELGSARDPTLNWPWDSEKSHPVSCPWFPSRYQEGDFSMPVWDIYSSGLAGFESQPSQSRFNMNLHGHQPHGTSKDPGEWQRQPGLLTMYLLPMAVTVPTWASDPLWLEVRSGRGGPWEHSRWVVGTQGKSPWFWDRWHKVGLG